MMTQTKYSFAQLNDKPLKSVKLEGIIYGAIFQEISKIPGISLTLAPHGDDTENDVSLDTKVIVFKQGNFDDQALHRLISAKQLGNRVRVDGSYVPQETETHVGRIDAKIIEIQPYS